MNDRELVTRYRNLLIVLAQQKEQALEEMAAIRRSMVQEEMHSGRRAGLNCKLNALHKHARKLEKILTRNRAASIQFFRTSDQKTISEQEIIYAQELLTAGQPLLTSRQQHAKDNHTDRDA